MSTPQNAPFSFFYGSSFKNRNRPHNPCYVPIARTQHKYVLDAIQKRDNDSGRCCYKVRRNGKGIDGTQKYRTAENTAKTKLLRPTLFDLVGNDKKLSFCYRKENELSDAEILYNAYKQGTL